MQERVALFRFRHSRSLAKRWHRLSEAIVRSTKPDDGKPLAPPTFVCSGVIALAGPTMPLETERQLHYMPAGGHDPGVSPWILILERLAAPTVFGPASDPGSLPGFGPGFPRA